MLDARYWMLVSGVRDSGVRCQGFRIQNKWIIGVMECWSDGEWMSGFAPTGWILDTRA